MIQPAAIKNVIPKNDVTNNNTPVKLEISLAASLLVSIFLSTFLPRFAILAYPFYA